MHLLPTSTVRLIASSQVITSVSSAVKELVENSLDAGASNIEVKLDGWGLEKIEVRDNGCGINPEDAPFMAQPHYTSKISSDSDLKSLVTYGFRGEALGALCMVSRVTVLSKTESEPVGMLYTLESTGKIGATQPKPASTGTTVTAANLFKNLPVRKQYSSGNKRCKEEIKKVEDLIMAYALVHPSLRIVLRHNKTFVWQKSKVSDHRTALLSVLGTSLMSQLDKVEFDDTQHSGLHMVGYFPVPGSDPDITGRAVNDRCFVFFNGRPVTMKQVSQLIKQFYISNVKGPSNKYPVSFLNVNVCPDRLDVNLEPNKTSVMLTDKDEFIAILTNLLERFYSDGNKIIQPGGTFDVNISKQKKELKSKDNLDSKAEDLPGQTEKSEVLFMDDSVRCCEAGADKNSNTEHSSQKDSGISMVVDFTSDEVTGSIAQDRICHSDGKTEPKKYARDASCASYEGMTRKNGTQHNSRSDSNFDLNLTSLGDETLSNLAISEFESGAVTSLNSNGSRVPEQNHCKKSASLDNSRSSGSDSLQHNTVMVSEGQLTKHRIDRSSGKSEDMFNKNEMSSSPRPKQLFSIDLDDMFNDTDFDFTTNGGDDIEKPLLDNNDHSAETPGVEQNDRNAGASTGGSSASKDSKQQLSVDSPPSNFSSGAEARNDKEWSMGHGLVDKKGNEIEPVTLLTRGPRRQLSLDQSTVIPLQGKRKHCSNEENSRLSLSRRKIKKVPEISNQPLISKVMSPNPLQRKLLYRKTNVPFCFDKLKHSTLRPADQEESSLGKDGSTAYHLIGRLDPWGVWLMRQGSDLFCVNQYRIQEQLLFQRLMSCHSLPKETLDRPIVLNERSVGGPKCWTKLCAMSSNCDPPDPTRYFDDERLTSNGFDICQKKDEDSGDIKVELRKVCSSIPFYGVPDLAETLGLIGQFDDSQGSSSLSNCRPLKVVNYLKSEAVRVARGLSSRMSKTEVNEILSRMKEQLPKETRTCIHDRPFFETIASVSV